MIIPVLSSLARLRIPLVYSDGADTGYLQVVANSLGTTELITVGSINVNIGLQTTSLADTEEIIKWLEDNDMKANYFGTPLKVSTTFQTK
ncbi:MAG: hypothetical protein GY749_45850 [Desulfobacteraceae bacterium]|nr:hypothetical protein [Desulfobacteraceae bacterium]